MTAYSSRVSGRTRLDEFTAVEHVGAFHAVASLHAHTHYSRESASDVPQYMIRIPLIGKSLERELRTCIEREGSTFSRMWWHPPVTARAVFESECEQIERRFGLLPMVSVTDHDDIRAGLDLQALYAARRTPISVEWTVPFGETFFHLGIHNLPASSAMEWFGRLADTTVRPDDRQVAQVLQDLDALDDVLVVFNHPQWDLAGVGPDAHARLLRDFLARYRWQLHALELNGYRAWSENERVWPVAKALNLPLVSGGDRHGSAPNALLNLTRAETFAAFVGEVRQGISHIVVMPEYRTHLAARVVASVSDVLSHQRSHPLGRRLWTDRVSWDAGGAVRTLSSQWPDGGPLWIRSAIGAFNLMASDLGLRMFGAALEVSERIAAREMLGWSPRGRPGIGANRVGDAT